MFLIIILFISILPLDLESGVFVNYYYSRLPWNSQLFFINSINKCKYDFVTFAS